MTLDTSLQDTGDYNQTLAQFDQVIAFLDAHRSQMRKRSVRAAVDCEPWGQFARRMRLLTPQSAGNLIQSYVAKFYNWQEVDQGLNRGDVVVESGEHAEFKASMITASNRKANFVQVRLFQDVDQYRFAVIDREFRFWRFDLTKEQMIREVRRCGHAAHVAKTSFKENLNQEWALRFTWNESNIDRARWLSTYLVDGETEPTPDLMLAGRYETAEQIRARLSVAVGAGAS